MDRQGNKMKNKRPLDRVKDARKTMSDRSDWVEENYETIEFALSYLEASINDVHSEDEPTSFDMLQEFMEGK